MPGCSRAVFKGGLRDQPPRNVNIFSNKYCICLYSKVVYEDAHKQAQAKLLPPDTFLSRKNAQKCVCGRDSAPEPAGGAYSAPPDPLAGNRVGAPGRGREKERRGGEEWEGKGKDYPPNENPGYGLGL